MIAGIDLSSFSVDIVFLDDGTSRHVSVSLRGRGVLGRDGDAFERSRGVLRALKDSHGMPLLYFCEAIGIEEPRGMNPGPTFRVQGAVLQYIPRDLLVYPWVPSQWRKKVGLPGNCTKETIMSHVKRIVPRSDDWTQDACDAWCIAEATRIAVADGRA